MGRIYFESDDIDRTAIVRSINNTMRQVPLDDRHAIDSIYITTRERKMQMVGSVNVAYPSLYLPNPNSGKPSICISSEELFRERPSGAQQVLMWVAAPLIASFGAIPILIMCVKDRNFKFWYVGKEYRIGRKYLDTRVSKLQRRLVACLLYFIGVRQTYGDYRNVGLELSERLRSRHLAQSRHIGSLIKRIRWECPIMYLNSNAGDTDDQS